MPKKVLYRVFSKDEIKDITQRMRHIRSLLKLTGAEFSVSLGLHRSYISQIEIAYTTPTFDVLGSLYKVYNVNPNYIMLGHLPIFMSDKPIGEKVEASTNANVVNQPLNVSEIALAHELRKLIHKMSKKSSGKSMGNKNSKNNDEQLDFEMDE